MPQSSPQPWQWVLVALGIVAIAVALAILIGYCTTASSRWRRRQGQNNFSNEEEKTIKSGVFNHDSFHTLSIATQPPMHLAPTSTIERPPMAWFPAPPLRPPPRRGKLPRVFKPSSSSLGTKSNSPESTSRGGGSNCITKKLSYIDISWRGPTPPWTMSSSHRNSFRQPHSTTDSKPAAKEDV